MAHHAIALYVGKQPCQYSEHSFHCIHGCIILFTLYSLPVFDMFYCCHFKYSVFFMFYVSLLYTCLSENSSDELTLSNSYVNRR